MKSPTFQELEKALAIDENNLEQMCRDQPVLYYEVSKALALAMSRRDEAKQNLAEYEAEEDTKIRRLVAKKEERTTEGEIKAMVKASKTVQDAASLFLRLSQSVQSLQALKESYSQRSYALSHMVDLHINTFYGEASTNRSVTNMRDARANAARVQLKNQRRELDQ